MHIGQASTTSHVLLTRLWRQKYSVLTTML